MWLAYYLGSHAQLAPALAAYRENRLAQYHGARERSATVEAALTPSDFAQSHPAFSHWMITQPESRPLTSAVTAR